MTGRLVPLGLAIALVLAACGSSNGNGTVDPGPGSDTAAPEDTAAPTDTVVPADTAVPTDTTMPVDTAVPPDTFVPGPPKVDLLLVVDDSSSMCQEQRALAGLFESLVGGLADVDLRVAVTTPNVCAADKEGAVRGKFVYQPATSLPPSCGERRRVPCMADADCQARADLPDAANWVCEGTTPDALWTCDLPPDVKQSTGADDKYPGDFLFSFHAECRYKCTKDADQCATVFGDPASACVYPGNDASHATCMVKPATTACPANGPKVLNASVVDAYLASWKGGSWAGDPSWAGKTDAEVRPLIRNLLFSCMTMIGAQQSICGNQEQGLLAAWMALDPAGENAVQAQSFVRADAVLAIVVVSDEDDCSGAAKVAAEDYGRCACLADTAGCTPDGTCGLTPGPLVPVADMVANLKSLKADPSKLVFTAITGGILAGSTMTPGADVVQAAKRYFECKCDIKAPRTAPYTFGCMSATGSAELGTRYLAVAGALGASGVSGNLCEANGIQASLAATATAILKAAGQ